VAARKKTRAVPLREMTLAMARLRRIDERMTLLQRQGRIGFYGAALGEEAAVIGSASALGAEDWLVPALRQNGAMLLRGYPLLTWMAQSFGSVLDPAHGRQMPNHPAAREVNQVSWSSCIGNQIPQGVGIAFAMKREGTQRVCMTYFGDGATSEADFHCAMTFAGVWRVPCVLVCQNNQWAISVGVEKQSKQPEIWRKAQAYGFAGVRVDGNDVEAVYAAAADAVDKARSGGGPTLLELFTYRVGAHSTSDDPNVYRDDKAGHAWFATHDPLPRALAACAREGVLSAAEVSEALRALDRELEAAVKTIEAAGLPPHDTLFSDVYATMPWHLQEQAKERGNGTTV
jgi:pyruvate dehydrogenase E1 component alpha subunit/2-oxoisovalerate dehydrogenase E1 component alpha subunit